ncbi:hypothetical protein F4604DRAFT_1183773 [Suillus subluteus]|nr:hypothetical protein F4604DRAFT_1183773 [Suillus subluteus]
MVQGITHFCPLTSDSSQSFAPSLKQIGYIVLMSRASITSKRSRRLSQEGSTDGAYDQSARLDDHPPPQNDTVRLADDQEEKSGPSVVQLLSGISNSGLAQTLEPCDTSNDSLNGSLAAYISSTRSQSPTHSYRLNEVQNEVQEDQPSPSEIVKVLQQVLDVLKDSTIASKTGKDDRSRFWAAYKRVAKEHDDEFLEQYNGNMDIVLIFSGLFSAVSTAFIVAMESNLSPDPDDTTHALLSQLVQIGLGNFTAAGPTPATPASNWSPSTANIRIQLIAYASLSMSLLAAFGAVLGKQWLGYYKSHRYSRGSEEE